MREIIDVNGTSHHSKHYYYYYHYHSGIVDPSLSESGAVNKALKEFVNVGDILVKLNGKLLEDTTLVEVAAWMKTIKENSIDRTLVFLKPRQVSLEAFLQKGIVISTFITSTVITHYSYLEYALNQAEGDRVYSIKSSMSTSAKKQQSSLSASTPTSAKEAEVNRSVSTSTSIQKQEGSEKVSTPSSIKNQQMSPTVSKAAVEEKESIQKKTLEDIKSSSIKASPSKGMYYSTSPDQVNVERGRSRSRSRSRSSDSSFSSSYYSRSSSYSYSRYHFNYRH